VTRRPAPAVETLAPVLAIGNLATVIAVVGGGQGNNGGCGPDPKTLVPKPQTLNPKSCALNSQP